MPLPLMLLVLLFVQLQLRLLNDLGVLLYKYKWTAC